MSISHADEFTRWVRVYALLGLSMAIGDAHVLRCLLGQCISILRDVYLRRRLVQEGCTVLA